VIETHSPRIATRPVRIVPDFVSAPPGAALVEMGRTRVLCVASVEDRVPAFLAGTNQGWLTAEYAMMPGATHPRSPRDRNRGRIDGRSQEIQRLIGRSLRMAVDLQRLGSRTIWIDCDVLEADGGTRTAAITGGWVALALALRRLEAQGVLEARDVLVRQIAAISAGIVDGAIVVDLAYAEDSRAEVDVNVVMTADGDLVEVQATAERTPIARPAFDALLDATARALPPIFAAQRAAVRQASG